MSTTVVDSYSRDPLFEYSITVGAQQSFYYRQHLNNSPSSAYKFKEPKHIVPTVPRQRTRAPPGSALSFIRSEKIPTRPSTPQQLNQLQQQTCALPLPPLPASKTARHRPSPLKSTQSSPASISTTPISSNRGRKVSFNEQVIVVRTVFTGDDNDDEEEEGKAGDDQQQQPWLAPRRRSTGSAPDKEPYQQSEEQVAGTTQQLLKMSSSLKSLGRRWLS